MMKAQVLTIEGKKDREIDLPLVFEEEYRPDLIKKAVIAIQSCRRQPHGTHPYAGIETSAVGWGSGRGASHLPRLKNGSRGARVPQAVGGREAHPPKVEKILERFINRKEKRKALNSAIAATTSDSVVRSRGHRFEGALPFVIEDRFEELTKTKDVVEVLKATGLYADVERSHSSRKIRPGKGKLRGRKYKQRKSLLIVTSRAPLTAAKNLAGVDIVTVGQINTELLAPGTHAGRLTIWTEGAIKGLEAR